MNNLISDGLTCKDCARYYDDLACIACNPSQSVMRDGKHCSGFEGADSEENRNTILYNKCMDIPIGYSVREVLYQRIIDMMVKSADVSGFGIALDYMTCDVIVGSAGDFSPKDLRAIKKYNSSLIEVRYGPDVLPSVKELMHYCNYNNLKLLIKISRDARMHVIYWVNEDFKIECNKLLAEERIKTENIAEAEKAATLKIYELNKRLNNKLFRVERF